MEMLLRSLSSPFNCPRVHLGSRGQLVNVRRVNGAGVAEASFQVPVTHLFKLTLCFTRLYLGAFQTRIVAF